MTLHTTITSMTQHLDREGISYCVEGATAMLLHGVALSAPELVEIYVQWDSLDDAYQQFHPFSPTWLPKNDGQAAFAFQFEALTAQIKCRYNTVVRTDPDRMHLQLNDAQGVWVKTLESLRRIAKDDDDVRERIDACFRARQSRLSLQNEAAWNDHAYESWVARYGTPVEAAAKIQLNPRARLAPLDTWLGDVRGQKVANLLGSHGSKAVALACLGATVTVVDISSGNARYASELAAAGGVQIRYIVSDVLALPTEERNGDYRWVVMELGILHYFVHLAPLMDLVASLLQSGGQLLLHDFHPVSTKLITSNGRKHKVTGNYFDTDLHDVDVAHAKFASAATTPAKVRLRRWTLGDIITAVAEAGLRVQRLDEEPNHKVDDIGLPKTFTLLAGRE